MFEWINAYFNGNLLDNQPSQIAVFLALIIFAIVFKGLLTPLLVRAVSGILMRKTSKNVLADFVIYTQKAANRLFEYIFVYVAFLQLNFPKDWNLTSSEKFGLKMVLNKSYQIFLIVLATVLIMRVINFWGKHFYQKALLTENKLDDHLVPFFKEITKVMAILIIFLFVLGNILNINVSTLVAGLGIGGIAVALASKETLENLFASFTIFLDRPFITGDLVQVGGILGRVEQVGFRTTRIRTSERSLITLPNKMMIDQPLDNWSERSVWRSRFDLDITYNTGIEQLKKIKLDITAYLHNHPKTDENSHAYFSELGSHSLKITIFFFAITNDYFEYMSIRDEINFELFRIIKDNRGDLAYPTRTIIHQSIPEPSPENL